MYFYEVHVSTQRYHGNDALTYSSDEQFGVGSIVLIPFGNSEVVGYVYSIVNKPPFPTKPIIKKLLEKELSTQTIQLHSWLHNYYPGPIGFSTQLFLPGSLATTPRSSKKSSDVDIKRVTLPKLTDEQVSVVKEIQGKDGSFLLHGETGSGKTRVYQELAMASVASNRSVLVLTPEIGLTPQLASSFEAIFPGQVVVAHSTQTTAQRRENWKRIHASDKPLIIIGPRSILFSPVGNLGLVILDEAHDQSYKQDSMPYYQASRVAAKLSDLHGAKLVLGSSTPSVEDYFVFHNKQLPILEMKQIAIQSGSKTDTVIVDLKERQNFSRSPWISDELIKHTEAALSEGLQSLMFLNRRGTARVVLCTNCGWQSACPRCDLPLTYHGDSHNMRCHTCGFTSSPPSVCPVCSAVDIKFKSIGTKTIESEVSRLFPKAKVKRFDADTHKDERLEETYDRIKNGEVDILVGTQMLSKGLDLPRLAVVGVIIADTSLYFPDYSAEEKTFQMIRQVTGRVGRGHHDGVTVIQTYHPDSLSLQAAVNKDYALFYNAQISERELYRFPPFYFVLKLSIERSIQASAQKTAHDVAQKILQLQLPVELVGPTPAFMEKTFNKYRWQIVVKSKHRSHLLDITKKLPKNVSYDIDPTNLL